MKIGSMVKYKDKPCLVLFVSGSGYAEIREYHENEGRIGSFAGSVERVHTSELISLDCPADLLNAPEIAASAMALEVAIA